MERPWLRHYEKGVPHDLQYDEKTLVDALRSSTEKFPQNPALIFFKEKISYQELDRLSTNFAKNLMERGVKKGDRVAIMAPNSPEFVISFFGSLKAGAVVVPVNSKYLGEEIAYVLQDSGAKTLVILDLFYPQVESHLPKTEVEQVVKATIKNYFPFLKKSLYPLKVWLETRKEKTEMNVTVPTATLQSWLESDRRETPLPEVKPKDLALLLYTSGTTGKPKGVMLNHKNLSINARQCISFVPTIEEGNERIVGALPFFHAFGVTACLIASVLMGGTLGLVYDPKDTESVLEIISQHQMTFFPGVPAMFAKIIEKGAGYDITCLKSCVSGADTLLPETQQRFEHLTKARISEGFGLSEAGPATHFNPLFPVDGKRRAKSIGLPVPSTDAKIVDLEDGSKVLGPNEPGELIIKGPQVMQGYWLLPAETAQVLKDGWLYTGDIARMDEDGYFYIEGRKKEMIIIGGENVFPVEVEEVLSQHPGIKEAAVVGVPREKGGEVIKAFVVLEENTRLSAEEVVSFCKGRLAEFKMPRLVEFRQELPKNPMGKVLRKDLKKEG